VSGRAEAERLLEELLAAGAVLVIASDRLRIEAPPGVLTAAHRDELVGNLSELRKLVEARWRSRESCVAPRPCRRMTVCARPAEGRPCVVAVTCCVCRTPLPSGHRYLCETCAALQAGR
jgi:hypothetical protein